MKKILITGSSGLIGSETVAYFAAKGYRVYGIDNNMRANFFGPSGDTTWNLARLISSVSEFEHFDIDIRKHGSVFSFFKDYRPDAVIHCAAQPSHDLAKDRPIDDFSVNAVGTLNLLEATRQFVAESPFVFMSTNKVYGDAPNEIPLVELEKRYDYARPEDFQGITETCRVDRCLHSLFGASKLAADVLTQEYGRYFNMPTVCFRGGCLTGPNHSGVELHGFLSYLVKVAIRGGRYFIYGYKGKQVRDQIHSIDVARAIDEYICNPRAGEVYNLGGGRENNASLLECVDMIQNKTGLKLATNYVEQNRIGDHICYMSNLSKFKSHYPNWSLTKSMDDILDELIAGEKSKSI